MTALSWRRVAALLLVLALNLYQTESSTGNPYATNAFALDHRQQLVQRSRVLQPQQQHRFPARPSPKPGALSRTVTPLHSSSAGGGSTVASAAKKKLLFVHIPKTGGTTLKALLEKMALKCHTDYLCIYACRRGKTYHSDQVILRQT